MSAIQPKSAAGVNMPTGIYVRQSIPQLPVENAGVPAGLARSAARLDRYSQSGTALISSMTCKTAAGATGPAILEMDAVITMP
jgi:hypothetical protein